MIWNVVDVVTADFTDVLLPLKDDLDCQRQERESESDQSCDEDSAQ